MQEEKATVGFYLSNHPLDEYKKILEDMNIKNIADFDEVKPGDKITIAGIVSGMQVKTARKVIGFVYLSLKINPVRSSVWVGPRLIQNLVLL